VRRLRLDVTPALINRTAIHHLIKDSISALGSVFELELAVAGRRIDQEALERGDSSLLEHLFFCLKYPLEAPKHARPHPGQFIPTVYFDPLYVVFIDLLLPHDFVFVLDMTTLTNPEWHDRNVGFLYAQAFEKLVSSQANLIAISEHTRLSIAANLPIPASDIATIALYPMQQLDRLVPECLKAVSGCKFLLFVGSLEERKNVAGLLTAFEASRLVESDFHLVIAGGDGMGAERIRALAQGIRNAHILGFVSSNTLAWLYQNATWFVYPSYLEGFGIPILEAMQAGLPMVGSITGAVPEVAGDAALFLDPHDDAQFCRILASLETFAEDRRMSMGSLSRSRAAMYSFSRYTNELISIVTGLATNRQESL
jgi:glycosyltransferase involved in cell wall biosynthesis